MLAKSLLLCMASAFVAASEVAVYWGQNSAGGQERLSTYCDSTSVDIVLVSFINGFPNLEVNFSNQCGLTYPSGLLHCPQIGEDIKYCQSKGKKVMISMGGASGTYGFSSEAEGSEFATTLWNKFGGGSDAERPFDDAVVDGFDFDIEHGAETGYVALAKGLQSYFASASKKYYLSAAPQCPYPDATLNQLLTSVALDYSFIQFYNNYCSLGPNFNWASWAEYAATVSPNKDIQLFLGLPGSAASAAGYTPSATVDQYLSDIQCGPNFGGFAIWDASSAWSNVDSNGDNYAVQLKNLLNEADPCTTSASSSSTTSTKSSTTAATTSAITVTSDVLSSSAFYGNVSSSAIPTSSEGATTFTTNYNTELITVTCTKDVCHHAKPTDAQNIYETSYGTEIVTVTCTKDVCHHVQPTEVAPDCNTYTTEYGTEVVTVTCTKDVCHHAQPTGIVAPEGTTYTTEYGTVVVTVTCTEDVCHQSIPATTVASVVTSSVPVVTSGAPVVSSVSTMYYTQGSGNASNETIPVYEGMASSAKMVPFLAVIAAIAITLI